MIEALMQVTVTSRSGGMDVTGLSLRKGQT